LCARRSLAVADDDVFSPTEWRRRAPQCHGGGSSEEHVEAEGATRLVWGGGAVITIVYLLNMVPCKAVDGKTPFEVWHGKRPAVLHLKTFGCIVYVRNTKPHLKLDDKGRKMIFVGYERGTKAYKAYDSVTKKVTIT
jgi:hypothetical protein